MHIIMYDNKTLRRKRQFFPRPPHQQLVGGHLEHSAAVIAAACQPIIRQNGAVTRHGHVACMGGKYCMYYV